MEIRTSNEEASSKTNITARGRCTSSRPRGSCGLSALVPLSVAQKIGVAHGSLTGSDGKPPMPAAPSLMAVSLLRRYEEAPLTCRHSRELAERSKS